MFLQLWVGFEVRMRGNGSDLPGTVVSADSEAIFGVIPRDREMFV
jgi:hypothetical protein